MSKMVPPLPHHRNQSSLEGVINFSGEESSEGAMDFSQGASHHHRHQASLEGITNVSNLMDVSSLVGVIDVSTEPPLGTRQRSVAEDKFRRIIRHFNTSDPDNHGPYNRARLIELTHEHALTERSRDNLLRTFFLAIALSIDDDKDIDFSELRPKFFGFADYLMDNFFLPLKACTKKTPQPTPTYHSAVQEVQGVIHGFVGTPARVSALRGECLVRDHHRCVVSRKFDLQEAEKRFALEEPGKLAKDDEEGLLHEQFEFASLEVAHILPHSLMRVNSNYELDSSREAALRVLNMFDHGVVHLIDGTDIDRPRNALTLTRDIHQVFGEFKIFFESIADGPDHAYEVKSFQVSALAFAMGLPVTRTLFLSKTRTIDPPSPRLLAIHRAIAHILHLSGAGEYIDRFLQNMDDKAIPADGSVDVGRMVQLSLSGWLGRGTMCN